MRATVGIDKRKNFAFGILNSCIARRTRTGPRFIQQACAGVTRNDSTWWNGRAVINHNDFVERMIQMLCVEAGKAGLKLCSLIEVRNDDGKERHI